MTDGPHPDAPSILLVDDDDAFRSALARSLRTRGYDVRIAATYDEALASVQLSHPRYAVVDVRMPGRSGLDLVKAIKGSDTKTAVLVLTGDRSLQLIADVAACGAIYLAKPADTEQVIAAFDRSAR